VLFGPGGTGKTELAKAFVRWWRDTGGVDDPRLVLWHSFEPGVANLGLDGVVTEIGLAMFGADFASLDSDQQLDAVKRLLAQYRALLLWDNFESVQEMPDLTGATPELDEAGCAQLREFLAWVRNHSRSAVIITSRAAEGWVGEVRRIAVGGLNRTEASQYAGYLLAPFPAAQARRERRSFGELLQWLDGHPLAMRLTLPRLDTTEPADLLAGLRGITPLSAEEDAEPSRLSSLGACITYSFAHLATQTRQLLPAVSLFQGIADVDVLATFSTVEGVPGRFSGVSPHQWTAVLDDAVRVGLLTGLGHGMYQIHPALPGYLAADWHAGDPVGYSQERETCEQALCAACSAFSQWLRGQIDSGSAMAYAYIGLQRRTLGAMLGHALDHQAWTEAVHIVRALDKYWSTRGLRGEADAWADRILATTTSPGQDAHARGSVAGLLWLHAALNQANRQKDAGQLDKAERSYERALAYLQDEPKTDLTLTNIAILYHQLGMTAQDRGRLDDADDWYRKSLSIRENLGNRSILAAPYHQLGMVAHRRGRVDDAEDWYRKSLAIEQEVGNQQGIAISYHWLGVVARDRGHLDEAENLFRQSLAIHQYLGDRSWIADNYQELGNNAQIPKRLDEAEDWYHKSLAINEALKNLPRMATLYLNFGNLAGARGKWRDAEDWYRRSLAILEKLDDRPGTANLLNNLGITALEQGRPEDAENWHRRSLSIRVDLGDMVGASFSYHNLGLVAQNQGRLDHAEKQYFRSLDIKENLGDWAGKAASYIQLGVLALQRNEPCSALEWMVRSVTMFTEFPHPMTGSAPAALVRLTSQLGVPALEQAWRQVTGQPVPQPIRDYIASHSGQAQAGDAP
jgi:tetratricopeptide (TPR) repeat protein